MSIKTLTKTAGGFLTKNSPTILTGMSVAGLISTALMAVRATPKALELIDDAAYEKYKSEKLDISFKEYLGGQESNSSCINVLSKREIIKTTYKCYIPAALMGAATIACIIGANSINLRRNAALAGAYSLTEKALKEYQNKVVETIGQNKERKIKDDIAKERLEKNPVSKNEIIMTGKGDTLCYDSISGRYFKSDMEKIKSVLNDLSSRLMSEMYISLNEVYSDLGLETIKLGDTLGWRPEHGLIKPDFSSQLAEDGTPCLVLDFHVEPRYYDYE